MRAQDIPRLLIAAPASGCGKTMIACGLLQVFKRRGLIPAGFKCGPDHIDPLFHREVLGVESGNLDGFFQDRKMMEESFLNGCMIRKRDGRADRPAGEAGSEKSGEGAGDVLADIAVIEGVMGYFDGFGQQGRASSWETARWLDCPVLLVVDGRGMSLSAAALIQGFLEFRPWEDGIGGTGVHTLSEDRAAHGAVWEQAHNGICGILLNRVSSGMYSTLKAELERRFKVPVVGYVPRLEEIRLESRHLGLKLPGEVEDLSGRILRLAQVLEKTVDVERLLAIAGRRETEGLEGMQDAAEHLKKEKPSTVTIGVAWDEAFCFYYRDNLELLEAEGARLQYFSPLHQERLPKGLDGLLLGGGYPELYARSLSENTGMREDIRQAALAGMPVFGECGGFLYLLESLEDEKGQAYPMTGALPGRSWGSGRLGHFGYITLFSEEDGLYLKKGETVRAHEFHYWDSDQCGDRMEARKPAGGRKWACMRQEGRILAGFPHLYYPSCPELVRRFVRQCEVYRGRGSSPKRGLVF